MAPIQQDSGNSTSSTSSGADMSSIRATKRKLDDAIQSLDDAVGSSSFSQPNERPTPAKKQILSRSLYSTLAKYGIKPKETNPLSEGSPYKTDLSKTAPHLAAILARTASRSRKILPFKTPQHPLVQAPSRSSISEYRPSSTQSFLSRLGTYKLATYANKPPAIDAVAASKCGWVNDGKDRLSCGICGVSWVVTGRDGMVKDAANSLIEKQRTSLVQMHKDGCPWKTRQCDASIYRIPLQSPLAMARDMKLNALTLEPVLQGVQVRHPLSNAQLKTLRSIIATVPIAPAFSEEGPSPMQVHGDPDASVFTDESSDSALLTSLFGWALAPPSPERLRTTSLSRANTNVPSRASTPSLSRANSVARMSEREATPVSSPMIPRTSSFRSPVNNQRDSSLLHCSLCQRRIGLWAFAPPPQNGSTAEDHETPPPAPKPQRQFDILKEHRSYCPYVVRSTVIPSLPLQPGATSHTNMSPQAQLKGLEGEIEGWRAVVAVVSRHGLGQRQRMALSRTMSGLSNEVSDGSEQEGRTDLEGVEAMVAGVKSRGGKDLLRYVKGLLG